MNGRYGNYIICIFKHTGTTAITASSVVTFNFANTGVSAITASNINSVRDKVFSSFYLDQMDSALFFQWMVVINRANYKSFWNHTSLQWG